MHAFLRALVAATALLTAAPAFSQMTFFPEELVVTASALNLRDKPDKSGKVLERQRIRRLELPPYGAASEELETSLGQVTCQPVIPDSKPGFESCAHSAWPMRADATSVVKRDMLQ